MFRWKKEKPQKLMEASTVICDDDSEVYENLSGKLLKDSNHGKNLLGKFPSNWIDHVFGHFLWSEFTNFTADLKKEAKNCRLILMRAWGKHLIVHCAVALVVFSDCLVDGVGRVATFVRFASAFEVFVFDHPEFFAVVEALGEK